MIDGRYLHFDIVSITFLNLLVTLLPAAIVTLRQFLGGGAEIIQAQVFDP